MRIRYSSSPSGSGKTHQIVARACDLAKRGMTVLIVQPTIELIDKTIKEELLSRLEVPMHRVFHSKAVDVGKSVAAELAEYLRYREDCGQIIFTTHQSMQLVPFWTKKSELHLLIDEDFSGCSLSESSAAPDPSLHHG